MNSLTITGNLTRDPDIRYTPQGTAVTNLTVASNERRGNKEYTTFTDIVAWRDLAENVALTLSKGMRVIVTGRLEGRSWKSEEGITHQKHELVASEIGPSLLFATADVQKTQRRNSTPGELPESDTVPADGTVEDVTTV